MLAETELSLAFLDTYPVSSGHALVIPRRHVALLWEMTAEEYGDAFALVRLIKDLIQDQFKPHGFNIGVNCGKAAGQSIFHAHIHVIPRYAGDVPNPKGGVRNVLPGQGVY